MQCEHYAYTLHINIAHVNTEGEIRIEKGSHEDKNCSDTSRNIYVLVWLRHLSDLELGKLPISV